MARKIIVRGSRPYATMDYSFYIIPSKVHTDREGHRTVSVRVQFALSWLPFGHLRVESHRMDPVRAVYEYSMPIGTRYRRAVETL